ncbi:MAG: hypothetical protein ABIP48_13160 [Planctomycetota bacterium]
MSEESRTRLQDLLIDPSFMKALQERLKRERSKRAQREEVSYEDADLTRRIDRTDRFIFQASLWGEDGLRDVFEKFVLSKLPNPKSITVEDLEEIAFHAFGGISDISTAAERFAVYVLLRLDEDWVEIFDPFPGGKFSDPFDFGKWIYSYDASAESWGDEGEVWELWVSTESGFSFAVTTAVYAVNMHECGIIPAALPVKPIDDSEGMHIAGYVVGDASRSAMKAVEMELQLFIPSIVKSFRLLAGDLDFGPDVEIPLSTGNCFPLNRTDLPFSTLVSPIGKAFFSQCISACVAPADSMAQRIKNAIHLVAQADSQQRPSIALALCFSAIEALLSTKTQGITDELSRHVATALEPDASKRLPIMKKMKKLYDKRSRALHGGSIEDDQIAWIGTRLVAAGVLAAATEWRDYQHRLGDQSDRRSFLEHLEDAETSGRRLIGIRDEIGTLCLSVLLKL